MNGRLILELTGSLEKYIFIKKSLSCILTSSHLNSLTVDVVLSRDF